MNNHQDCRCWRCWIQDNFTVIVLLVLVLVSLTVTVVIMHEKSIPDEYAKWAQGFTEGLLTGLTLAMNRSAEKPHPLAPGTTEATIRVEPPVPPLKKESDAIPGSSSGLTSGGSTAETPQQENAK